jgi:Lar family restriction alleviation protein
MTDKKLKPCPFCGGEATKLYDARGNFHEIVCLNEGCDITVETVYWIPESAAVASWNRRTK